MSVKKVSPVASLSRADSQSNVDGSGSDKSDNIVKVDEVDTQDLPNTQDFGGAEALVNLQTKPTNFGEEDGNI
jgi:hypothetical protein